jgi:hypothetical protein
MKPGEYIIVELDGSGQPGMAAGAENGQLPIDSGDLLALRIRNLIAAREFNTATANRELQCGDGWLCDHGQYDRELANEIDELFKKANARFRDIDRAAIERARITKDLALDGLTFCRECDGVGCKVCDWQGTEPLYQGVSLPESEG